LLSRSAARTAMLDSSASRDFIDQGDAIGYFVSTNPADPDGWTADASQSARETQYLADQRGLSKLLLSRHVPYDVVTLPHADAGSLAAYGMIVVPSPAALSAAQIQLID